MIAGLCSLALVEPAHAGTSASGATPLAESHRATRTVCASGCDHPTVQAAINAANSGDVISVGAGTFLGDAGYQGGLSVDKSLTIEGAGVASTTIDLSAAVSYGIHVTASGVTLRGFKLLGPAQSQSGNYGIKAEGVSTTVKNTGLTIENVTVQNAYRSGVDINGWDGVTITALTATGSTRGRGLVLTDVDNATLTGITTSSNAWGGIGLSVYGRYYPLGSANVHIVSMTSSEVNPLDWDLGNYNSPGTLVLPTGFTAPAGYNAYTVKNAASGGFQLWNFVPTKTVAFTLAAASAGAVVVDPAGTFHVGGTMPIQATLDAATSGATVEVNDGTYTENLSISKPLTLRSSNGRAVTTIQGISGVNALGTILVTSGTDNVTLGGAGKGFTVIGIDNNNPGIENAAVYFQGAHATATVQDNDIRANGDAGLMGEYGVANTGFTITGNTFSGKTFVGTNPAGSGFGTQFTEANVPRQLVVFGNGGGDAASATATGFTFTNNLITGTAGGMTTGATEQGNGLVTLDVANSTITGNTFSGTTNRYAHALRVRRAGTAISGNTFVSTGLGVNTTPLFVQNNTTAVQTIVGANTFDKGTFVHGGTSVWLTVSNAVAAATAGGTVGVLPSTYAENVTVDKVLTINGPNAGKAGTALDRSAEAIVTALNVQVLGVIDGLQVAGLTFTGMAAPQVALVSGNTVVSEGAGAVATVLASGLTTLTINGTGGADMLTVSLAGGNAIPSGGLAFNGLAGVDAVTVSGGTAASVVHTFANASDGTIAYDGRTLTYTGLEPISDLVAATNRTFNFAATADAITLVDDATAGNGRSVIDSPNSEAVTFAAPSGTLTVNAGDGADTITLRGARQRAGWHGGAQRRWRR